MDFSFYEILDHHRVFEPALLEGFPVLKVSTTQTLLFIACVLTARVLCTYLCLLCAMHCASALLVDAGVLGSF